jgi:hypothetical protein
VKKNRPKCSPKPFLPVNIIYRAKSSQQFWATSVMFKELPKVNNHPIGQNSPNQVTLIAGRFHSTNTEKFSANTISAKRILRAFHGPIFFKQN